MNRDDWRWLPGSLVTVSGRVVDTAPQPVYRQVYVLDNITISGEYAVMATVRYLICVGLVGVIGCAVNAVDSSPPAPHIAGVPAKVKFTSISAGNVFTCGVTEADGSVLCWGRDDEGQVSDVPEGEFVSVSAGFKTACAVMVSDPIDGGVMDGGVMDDDGAAGGRLKCWGRDQDGQVEDAPETDDEGDALAFTQVSVGSVHVCGVRADNGLLECWGGGSRGQVKDTPSKDGDVFVSISVGGSHSCGVRADSGFVTCWGSKNPQPATDGNNNQGQVTDTPERVEFLAVSAGSTHSCAIVAADNTAYCWGSDVSGQSTGVPEMPDTLPVAYYKYSSVSAGLQHTCAVRAGNGKIHCWGRDTHGQVSDVPSGEFMSVTAGFQHTCGLRPDGIAECWGWGVDEPVAAAAVPDAG